MCDKSFFSSDWKNNWFLSPFCVCLYGYKICIYINIYRSNTLVKLEQLCFNKSHHIKSPCFTSLLYLCICILAYAYCIYNHFNLFILPESYAKLAICKYLKYHFKIFIVSECCLQRPKVKKQLFPLGFLKHKRNMKEIWLHCNVIKPSPLLDHQSLLDT